MSLLSQNCRIAYRNDMPCAQRAEKGGMHYGIPPSPAPLSSVPRDSDAKTLVKMFSKQHQDIRGLYWDCTAHKRCSCSGIREWSVWVKSVQKALAQPIFRMSVSSSGGERAKGTPNPWLLSSVDHQPPSVKHQLPPGVTCISATAAG